MKSNLALKNYETDHIYMTSLKYIKTTKEIDGLHINCEFKKSKRINIKEIVGMILVVSVFMLGFIYVMLNLDIFCTIYR